MTLYNKMFYIIDGFDFSQNPKSTFTKENGETIDFIQYYQEKYNVTINQVNQPLIIALEKKTKK